MPATDPLSAIRVISPVDGRIYLERPLADPEQIEAALTRATAAQVAWRKVSLARRIDIVSQFVDRLLAKRSEIVPELSWQMGRPISHGAGELRGFEERARHMIAIAEESLAPLQAPPKAGFSRFITREPLGVVLVVAAWNFPYLIAVNSIVPALLAGNAVLLKHSDQTPLCAERLREAFDEAGLPAGLFQVLHLSHPQTAELIGDPRIDFVAFTGSVRGGRAVHEAAASRFIHVGLELGGKDPAYVRADAPLDDTVDNLVDGAFFNCGQSCCAVERIYVHRDRYDAFVEQFVAKVEELNLGNPLDPKTTLGPLVRQRAARFVESQVKDAQAAGARALIDAARYDVEPDSAYLAPQVLVEVDHRMEIMREETFGPVACIMPVASDDEAISLMNDSRFGLTASVWTTDERAARTIGTQVETGTWFMNRCDYLDPALAWVGVKDSGQGCSLSPLGFAQLTRPKSFHLRTDTSR